MKKVISLMLGFMLIIGCAALPVAAVKVSPEIDDIISEVISTDSDGEDAGITLERYTGDVPEGLLPETDDQRLIGVYSVIIDGTPKYPVIMDVELYGIKKGTDMYVLAMDEDGNVTKIPVEVIADGKIKFTFDKDYTMISLIADKEAVTEIGVSDKTADLVTPVVFGMLIASLAALVIAAKKIREN